MWRPRPTPLMFLSWLEVRQPNNLKSLLWSSALIPIPSSSTEIYIILFWHLSKYWWCSECSNQSVLSILVHFIQIYPPLGVNLRAFDCKLSMICYIRFMSEHIMYKFSFCNVSNPKSLVESLTLPNSAYIYRIDMISSIASFRLKF